MTLNALNSVLLLAISSSAACCDLNSSSPLPATLTPLHADEPPRQVVISNNVQLQVPQADGILTIHSAERLALIAQLTHWPTPSGTINSIKSQPVVLDQDYDGVADALYVADVTGQLWFVPLNSSGFARPQLIADFGATQAQFHQPLQIVQTVAADSSGVLKRQTMLLLIANQLDDGDMLIVVKHRAGPAQTLQLADLTDRTDISADEQHTGITERLWSQIQQAGGWYIRMQQRITVIPQVYAGVVYFTSANHTAVMPDCSVADGTASELHAVHLHHAGAVYARRSWNIETAGASQLALVKNSQGELELRLHNEQQQQNLLTELLGVTDECADCVAELSAGQFPRIIRLATFQTEHGAH
jgi:hypothetical protein